MRPPQAAPYPRIFSLYKKKQTPHPHCEARGHAAQQLRALPGVQAWAQGQGGSQLGGGEGGQLLGQHRAQAGLEGGR
jgi:hypothetical protein